MRALPGVTAAAIGADLPLRGNQSGGQLTYEGGPRDGVSYARHRVSPDYFATLGIPLQRGRVFTSADGPDAPRVAVVSATMARRLWPDRDPIGQRIGSVGADVPTAIQVVGVVGDVRFRDLTGDLLGLSALVDVYFPFARRPTRPSSSWYAAGRIRRRSRLVCGARYRSSTRRSLSSRWHR